MEFKFLGKDPMTKAVKEYLLTQIKVMVGTRISMETLEQCRVEVMNDIMTNHIVISFAAYFLAEETEAVTKVYGGQTVTKTVRYPKNWWEDFKDMYFHGWLLRHFPVKMKSISVTAKTPKRMITLRRMAVYPQAHMVMPKLGQPLMKFQELDMEVFP